MMGKFNEPWPADASMSSYHISDRNGDCIVSMDAFNDELPESFLRIVACVNAMAGVDDPEKFMSELREGNS